MKILKATPALFAAELTRPPKPVIAFITVHRCHQVSGLDAGAGLRWGVSRWGVEPMCARLGDHGIVISPPTRNEWVAQAPTER